MKIHFIKTFSTGVLIALLTIPVQAKVLTMKVDKAHSYVGFSIKHMMVSKVHGKFSDYKGDVSYDDQSNLITQIEVNIPVNSIDTGNQKRDEHLLSEDFFNERKYSKITFKSHSVTQKEDGTYETLGILDMHGISNLVTLKLDVSGPIIDKKGKKHLGISLRQDIMRSEWGLAYNSILDSGGVVIGEKVHLEIDVEVVQ